MTNTTTQIQALQIREAVQESLITFILRTNSDQRDYDEASAIAAFDSMLTDFGSLGEVLDYLTETAV